MTQSFEVVVIGAGQAGLATSYFLAKGGVEHVVLERGRIAETWRSQRWDSFCLNTPNWCSSLPGSDFGQADPDAFGHRDDFVSYLEQYARTFALPVREHTPVERLKRLGTGEYEVSTDAGTIRADAVVLANGSMSRARMPAAAKALPPDVLSISTGEYRSPDELPAGAVLVVGAGQSGCQIAEDLLEAGRRVYLCASRVGRVPRTYRGREILYWWRDMGLLDVSKDDLEDPSTQNATQPQVSGTNGGHTVSLQSLARDGAKLLGRLLDVEGDTVVVAGDLLDSIAFADGKSQDFKTSIDEWIEQHGLSADPPAEDPGEPALPDLEGSDEWRALELRDAGVRCVIWCTGFDSDWSWVDVDVFDGEGRPRHVHGVTDAEGLYFVGHPWLSKRSSGIIHGVGQDAQRIVHHIRSEVLRAEGSS